MTKTLLILALSLGASLLNAQDFSQEIKTRQNLFTDIEEQSDWIEEELGEDNPNWQGIKTAAEKLIVNTTQLDALFIAGSDENSRAKAAIWQDHNKFNAALNTMLTAFESLDQASQLQNLTAAKSGLEQAQDTCNGCHRRYRSLW